VRLRDLELAEKDFLIVNGWHSVRIRKFTVWKHPQHEDCDQDTAVSLQKRIDRDWKRDGSAP
jgi:hypothetical protein